MCNVAWLVARCVCHFTLLLLVAGSLCRGGVSWGYMIGLEVDGMVAERDDGYGKGGKESGSLLTVSRRRGTLSRRAGVRHPAHILRVSRQVEEM